MGNSSKEVRTTVLWSKTILIIDHPQKLTTSRLPNSRQFGGVKHNSNDEVDSVNKKWRWLKKRTGSFFFHLTKFQVEVSLPCTGMSVRSPKITSNWRPSSLRRWSWSSPLSCFSHWQESRSQKILRRNDLIISLSLEKMEFSVLFLVSIFKMLRKKILFLFSIYEIFQTILFLFSIFKIFKKNSLSFLNFWDSKTRFSFSSRIFKILREKSLSLLD